VEVRVLFRALLTHNRRDTATEIAQVDTISWPMNEAGDKLVTNVGSGSAIRSKSERSKRKKKQGPQLVVKVGSATVPIYRIESKGRVRFTLSFYREGRRVRKVFGTLDAAKREAQFVAHAPPELVPILAIGAFSGIRMAELNRLDWKAVDLERKFIEVRAGQAKTASRRIIPISDNLAA